MKEEKKTTKRAWLIFPCLEESDFVKISLQESECFKECKRKYKSETESVSHKESKSALTEFRLSCVHSSVRYFALTRENNALSL